MPVVCGCPRDQLCDECLNQQIRCLGGVARARGMSWAERVAAARPDLLVQPWPPLTGRCAAIAVRQVVDLTADTRAAERLATELDHEARRRWDQLRPVRA